MEHLLKKAVERTGPKTGCLVSLLGLWGVSGVLPLLAVVWGLVTALVRYGPNLAYGLSGDFPTYLGWLLSSVVCFIIYMAPASSHQRANEARFNKLILWVNSNGEQDSTILSCGRWVGFINEGRRRMSFFDLSKRLEAPQKVLLFEQITGIEVLQNNAKTVSIGGALAGGLLAGGVGAAIGAGTSGGSSDMTLVFYLKDLKEPTYLLPLLDAPCRTTSEEFKQAQSFAQHIIGLIRVVNKI